MTSYILHYNIIQEYIIWNKDLYTCIGNNRRATYKNILSTAQGECRISNIIMEKRCILYLVCFMLDYVIIE